MDYQNWIDAYAKANPIENMCRETTTAMAKSFPELKRVFGYALCIDESGQVEKWPHWWCTTPDKAIVDPTLAQFPGLLGYHPIPVHDINDKCFNCGAQLEEEKNFCDEKCFEKVCTDLNF